MDKKEKDINNNQLELEEETSFSESIINTIIKIKPHITLLWLNKRKLFIINFLVLILTLIYLLFLVKPYFSSTIVILPDYGGNTNELLGQLSGLASMAGVNIGESSPTQIYENLLMSEEVLSDVIYAKYENEKFQQPVNLIEYFEIEPDESLTAELQKRKMFLECYKLLSKKLQTNVDRMTKILSITVEMPESRLSADVANKIVESLDKYVRTKRKTFATEQRKYLDMRIKQVSDTLKIFEEELKRFREKNRLISQSPELQLEHTRLVRNVEIQQAIFTELKKQIEIIKLAEIKNTPIINLREQAKEPVVKAGPKRLIILIVIMILSFTISSIYILSRNKIKEISFYLKHG